MPELLSPDIRTGYDAQTSFDIKMDTLNRLNEVFNRPSRDFGIDYFDPTTGLTANQLATQSLTQQTTQPPLDFSKAITSTDPKVRDLALQVLEKSAYSDPYARFGTGKEFRTPYDRNVAKFIDKKYGYDMFSDNEDFYYRNSYMDDGWFVRALKNVMKFNTRVAVGTATKFLEGLGYLGSMVTNGVIDGAKALGGSEVHYWEDVADNAFSKIMKNANDDFRDYVTPVYKQAGFDEKGFFSRLTDWSFWNDEVADGVSFMASAFIPAGIASKTGLLAKGATLGAEVGAEASLAARAGSALRTGIRLATGAETYGEAGLSIFNVANEAAFQATGQYSETKQQLIDARKRGENSYTDREIQEMSGKAAASSFGWNFPALMVSNAWEMKNIIKPIAGRVKNSTMNTARVVVSDSGELGFKQYKNKFYGKIAESYVGKVARKYVPIAAQGTMVEGFWEENIQNAIDRASRGEYTRIGDDTDTKGAIEKARGGFLGILEQYVKQTIESLKGNDIENSISIGLGGILGVAGGVGGTKVGRRIVPGKFTTDKEGNTIPATSLFIGERRQQELALASVMTETNNSYNNFLSIQDVKKENGEIDEAKLTAKVAAFESFASKQEILDDLKTKKTYSPEELQVLQNKLLNDYIRGVAKVDKIDEAVKRVQDLANRNVEAKGETYVANPVEVAEYLTQVAKDYNRVQKSPNHVSDKYTPAQLQDINVTIKDRAFDLIAERRALQPILKNYEKQVNDNFTKILDFLQNDTKLPQGEYIQQALARSLAKEYIDAIAKKQVFTDLSDKDAPAFLKEYHKAKIKEADDKIADLNKQLGQNAPVIKDGKIQFNDKVIDFKSKLLTSILDGYQTAYTDQAEVEFAQQHNEHIADAILDPKNGLSNWEDYLGYVARAIEKKSIPSSTVEETKPETETQTVTETGTSTNTGDTTTDDGGEIPDEDIITGDGDGDKVARDGVDPNNPLSWYTPLKSSTDDTIIVSEEIEQLKDVPYDEVRKLVIREIMGNVKDFNDKYKLFMVKDTFPEIYKAPANNTNTEEAVVPSGEVIVIEKQDGTLATVKDFFGPKYKDMADLPIVFSAETEIFRNYFVPERTAIWAREMKATIEEASKFYETEHQRGKQARDLIKKDASAKIRLEVIAATDGILPTTKNVVPVTQRFGDKFTLSVKTQDSTEFKKGTIVATFGNVSFAVGTTRLRSSATDLVNVQKVLDKEYEDYDSANQVRNQYLNVMFYTDRQNQNFGIKKVGENYKIVFRKLDDKDKNLPEEQKPKALKESTAYGDLRFNVSKEGIKNGMNMYNPTTEQFTFITPEEYQDFIKTKAVTSLKKTLDKNGNLYMKPVNAYFSFNITDNRFKAEYAQKIQEANFNKIMARIEQVFADGKINIEEWKKHAKEYLKKKSISTEQFNAMNKRLGEMEKELKAKPKPKEESVTKTEEKPEPKTEEQEEDEEEKFKKLKAQEREKEKKKADVAQTVGNVGNKEENTYTVTFNNEKYSLNLLNGYITKPLIIGTMVKNFVVAKSDKNYVKILDEIAKAYPFRKNEDGTISGMLKVELEGQDQIFTAYGLPVEKDNDVFVDATNKIVRTVDIEGGELSPIPFLKTLLTDKGKAQLEDFLKRNC